MARQTNAELLLAALVLCDVAGRESTTAVHAAVLRLGRSVRTANEAVATAERARNRVVRVLHLQLDREDPLWRLRAPPSLDEIEHPSVALRQAYWLGTRAFLRDARGASYAPLRRISRDRARQFIRHLVRWRALLAEARLQAASRWRQLALPFAAQASGAAGA